MPEATVLYTVTAVVVLGLIAWVAAVLMTAKQPWARASMPRSDEADGQPLLTPESEGRAPSDADATARATPASRASASEAAKDEKDVGA